MKILNLSFGHRIVGSGIVDMIIACIYLYQKTISPDHGVLRRRNQIHRCRFFPSCSDYAIDSLRQYGLSRGIMVSLKRILRCNPFVAGGYDPLV